MVRRDRPQPLVADLSKAAVLFFSPWGEGQGEGKGGLETLVWDHPFSIASGVLSLHLLRFTLSNRTAPKITNPSTTFCV